MWRRVGSYLYHLVLLIILVVELTTLAALVYTLLTYSGLHQALARYDFLKLALVICTVCILILVAYILIYPPLSQRADVRYQRRYAVWLQRWCDVLLDVADLPRAPLPSVGITALLDQSALLAGSDSKWLGEVVTRYGLERRWLREAKSRRVDQRLAALAALEAAALPQTLPLVLEQMHSRHLLTQIAAARAAVRILAVMPDLHPKHENVLQVATTLVEVYLPPGIVEEILSLDLRASQPLLTELLGRRVLPATLVQPLIAVVGQLRLVDMAVRVADFVTSPRPAEVAAALHTLTILGYFPPAALPVVRRYALDTHALVALEAVRLLALLPLERVQDVFWRALAHPVWEVRRETIFALLQYGTPGIELAQQAAQQHSDEAALHIARQFTLIPGQQGAPDLWLGTAV